jgi:hypothetical protein
VPCAAPGAGSSRTRAPLPGGTNTSSATGGPDPAAPTGSGFAWGGSGRAPAIQMWAATLSRHSTGFAAVATSLGTSGGYPGAGCIALFGASARSAADTRTAAAPPGLPRISAASVWVSGASPSAWTA